SGGSAGTVRGGLFSWLTSEQEARVEAGLGSVGLESVEQRHAARAAIVEREQRARVVGGAGDVEQSGDRSLDREARGLERAQVDPREARRARLECPGAQTVVRDGQREPAVGQHREALAPLQVEHEETRVGRLQQLAAAERVTGYVEHLSHLRIEVQ